MGFNPPVPQQDNNWEIRVAVIFSLLLQVLLFFAGPVRKRSSSPVASFAIWSCFLLADWVADLALGLILNNMGNIGGAATSANSGGGSPIIFAFWTPFLLLHLGGQDTITGYSIEDNDLWRRHLVGLLFELFSASVIFVCSLQGNPMIPATVLMFAVGIIKYSERTYSLYSSSVDGTLANIFGDPDPGPDYAKLMTAFDGMEKAGLPVEIVIADGEAKMAKDALEEDTVVSDTKNSNRSLEAWAYEFFTTFRRLCFDLTLSSRERNMSKAYFLKRDDMTAMKAFEVMELELNLIYDMMHTKEPVAHTKAGCALRLVGSACIVSALVIFFHLDKGSIQRVDVGITYTLLLGGLALDVAALAMLLFSNWTLIFLEYSGRLGWLARAVRLLRPPTRRWSKMTSQLNLISYCLGKPGRAIGALTKVADALHVREIFDDFFFIRREPLIFRQDGEEPLLSFVFEGMRGVAEDILEVSNYRGQGVLKKLLKPEELHHVLLGSVSWRDFDESLLMWHIATDLCMLPLYGPQSYQTTLHISISKTLSEYMLYLLIKQPKMLLASAGVGLKPFQDTCAEARRLFEKAAVWDPNHEDARRMLLGVNTSKHPLEVKGDRSKSVLFDACILAKVLRQLGDDLMWEVVAGVWCEMLTYAATKCKGSTHVQQLCRGGEFITMVWLLRAHMGFADVYKMRPEGDGEAKIIVHDH